MSCSSVTYNHCELRQRLTVRVAGQTHHCPASSTKLSCRVYQPGDRGSPGPQDSFVADGRSSISDSWCSMVTLCPAAHSSSLFPRPAPLPGPGHLGEMLILSPIQTYRISSSEPSNPGFHEPLDSDARLSSRTHCSGVHSTFHTEFYILEKF